MQGIDKTCHISRQGAHGIKCHMAGQIVHHVHPEVIFRPVAEELAPGLVAQHDHLSKCFLESKAQSENAGQATFISDPACFAARRASPVRKMPSFRKMRKKQLEAVTK